MHSEDLLVPTLRSLGVLIDEMNQKTDKVVKNFVECWSFCDFEGLVLTHNKLLISLQKRKAYSIAS